MRKSLFVILILTITAVLFFFLIAKYSNGARSLGAGRVCWQKKCFQVDLAASLPEWRSGLMFRKNLKPESGMLFIFETEGRYPFWMKNTLIPLDIIWMDARQKVVFISENNLPCGQATSCPEIIPDQNALYVLEINVGKVKEIGLKTGDFMKIER